MGMILLGVSAVVPSLLLMWYFHHRDVFREPPGVLWATFGLGVLIVIPVLMVAWPFALLADAVEQVLVAGFIDAFFTAAVPEEMFKFLVVWFFAARNRAFDEPMDGIVYGVAASLGFATLENILYVSSTGFATAVVRAVTAVPAHAFFGAIMGYFVGQAVTGPVEQRRAQLLRALGWPILVHGLYDFPLMAADAAAGMSTASAQVAHLLLPLPLVLVVVMWRWALRLVNRLRLEQLAMDGPPAAPLLAPAAEPGSGRGVGWLLIVLGGLAAAFGGLLTLGVVLGLAFGEVPPEELTMLITGWVVVALLPLAGGILAFVNGIVRLNRAAEAVAVAVVTAAAEEP